MKSGTFVYIREGDEKDAWGVVRLVSDGDYHVAIADGRDVRLFERGELRKPRRTPEWWTG
ncbi:hypothetical protein ACWDRR_00805 [Kitasatospora sp. NPDC003701]